MSGYSRHTMCDFAPGLPARQKICFDEKTCPGAPEGRRWIPHPPLFAHLACVGTLSSHKTEITDGTACSGQNNCQVWGEFRNGHALSPSYDMKYFIKSWIMRTF